MKREKSNMRNGSSWEWVCGFMNKCAELEGKLMMNSYFWREIERECVLLGERGSKDHNTPIWNPTCEAHGLLTELLTEMGCKYEFDTKFRVQVPYWLFLIVGYHFGRVIKVQTLLLKKTPKIINYAFLRWKKHL